MNILWVLRYLLFFGGHFKHDYFGAVTKIKYFWGLEHFLVGLYPGSLNSIKFLEH